MAPVFQSEEQWLAEVRAMREAMANLPPLESLPHLNQHMYGDDIDLTYSSNDEEDIWDVDGDSDPDDTPPSEDAHINGFSTPELPAQSGHSRSWLKQKCQDFSRTRSGIDAADLEQQLVALLASDSSDEELQMLLADMIGYDDLDFVIELISHRKEALSDPPASHKQTDDLFAGLQTKKERHAMLRQQDFEHKHAPLAGAQDRAGPHYPHVYKSDIAAIGNTLDVSGRRYGLPLGSERQEHPKYEEYSIPAVKVGSVASGQRLVPISEMDGLCQRTFKGYSTLNRMQSLLYPVAYTTSENMLICAPTGAGKTDAAMLTILNTIAHNIVPNPIESPDATEFELLAQDFKIVYVAPMKALAAEVTEKLGKRLAWLGVQVREYTGDMQLTRDEIRASQILVVTPEKWDIATRTGSGDTELVQKVRLLIIDEVHMLHDERGAVLESLVARTERQVESTQSLIRLVGLSATLPNYIDVADFLKVNRMAGLFYFDASFRPVPLEQHFIGVKGKPGSKASRDNLDAVTFEKVKSLLKQDKQVMVFVHSRKDTVNAAKSLYTMAIDDGCTDLFVPDPGDPVYVQALADLKQTRARELRDIVPQGFGCHNAGMPRSDRNFVERIFAQGAIRVLCCTATLAWGVNLPAAAVIIKGTQLYSAEVARFVDLGILDVLQIFGRAGRPQFQDTGIGFICTTQDKLQHYLSAVTQQQPIESKFSKRLVDNLNAEIALGTVTNVAEGIAWLGYSYLFVRMRRNPQAYGIEWDEFQDDPQLGQRRRKLIIDAARTLHRSQMIIFNETTDELKPKDVGRIASHKYIMQDSVEIFNTMMRPQASEADILKMLSMSGEFDQIQSRDTEAQELQRLRSEATVCEVEDKKSAQSSNPAATADTNANVKVKVKGKDNAADQETKTIQNHAKTNILLQAYISRARIEDFTLVSDSNYIAQNAGRICRALFEIALKRGWGHQCLVLLSMCKAIEKRIWPFQHPLYQFDLPQPVMKNLDEKIPTSNIDSLREMEPAEIGALVHNQKMGGTITKILRNFPTVSVEAEIAPLNRDVLRLKLFLYPEFSWNDRHHGKMESYWVWVENSESSEIYHHERFMLERKKLHHDHELEFTIPLADPLPSQIYVRVVSDRWLGAETVHPVSFQHLIRPDTESVFTDLLNLQPLPVTALKNPPLEEVYSQKFSYFNAMQTQIFHTLYHTSNNVFLGSPTGSGKTLAAELAMWQAFRDHPGSKVVYIAPMKALVRERLNDWGKRLARPLGLRLVELTGDNTPDTRAINDADIIVTTPEKWDGISRSWQNRSYVRKVSLVIIDEIHLLGGDRGPILEIIVSRMNYIATQAEAGTIRLLGMSTAAANAVDLANWLGVKPGNNQACSTSAIAPTYMAIKTHSPTKPVIVFVASRKQTRLTAKELVNLCGMEDNPRRFSHFDSEEDLELTLSTVKDDSFREALSFGIGLHHAGLVESDRSLAEQLFATNKIQILVATATLAWGVNLPAHLVVVKGTQFFDAKTEGYKDMDLTDVLQMLGRAGRPQFDTSGVARIFTQDAKKSFYKHFLHTGFPVESTLHKTLDNHLGAEISAGTITTKQDALDYLTWTFFFRRLHKNPSYYGLELSAEEHKENPLAARQLAADYVVSLVDKSVADLTDSSCIESEPNGNVDPTPFGKIMSYYYLSHSSIRNFIAKARATPVGKADIGAVLSWAAQATEYDEIPVRHNEDITNASIAPNMPYNALELMKDMPMWDPHLKAFLLIQCHILRIDSHNSEYITDQNTVLDQVVRIIQAGIDTMVEIDNGRLDAVRSYIALLQSIKSARWPSDYPLSILPGVNDKWDETLNGKVPRDLNALVHTMHNTGRNNNSLDKIMDALSVNTSHRRGEFVRAARYLPDLDPKAEAHSKEADGSPEITLTVTRKNPLVNANEAKIYAPRFPKSQTEATSPFWNVGKGTPNGPTSNPRRAGQGQQLTTNVKLRLEPATFDREVDVVVISDCYPGMEWRVERVAVPRTEPPKKENVDTVEVSIDEGLVRKAKQKKEAEEAAKKKE
ncbi:putative helicase mug81 [Cyphellophora attinorum]|uniref:Putative helicase mug81 n=1 Tax=Cyphellophora attinorum TaxID=1664694 RepID=A0A0N1HRY6_9EURO|nr:putative helicase mug81 [Phialophora attinorum]KPI41227.1 putative helicase mug81 [Phialophora attinorum]